MPEQFPYPETGWSTGKMRMAKVGPLRSGISGNEYREIMGQKKQREQRLSQAGDYDPYNVTGKYGTFYGEKEPFKPDIEMRSMDDWRDLKDKHGVNMDDWEAIMHSEDGKIGVRLKKKPESAPLTSEWEGPSEGPGPQRATG
jgi:hypothetical protein